MVQQLHVFLVPIISSHDKLWGLARRVYTLFVVEVLLVATAGDGEVVAGAVARQKGVETDCDAGEGADAINQSIYQLPN